MVVFRDEGAFEPTTEMWNRGSRTVSLTWEVLIADSIHILDVL